MTAYSKHAGRRSTSGLLRVLRQESWRTMIEDVRLPSLSGAWGRVLLERFARRACADSRHNLQSDEIGRRDLVLLAERQRHSV